MPLDFNKMCFNVVVTEMKMGLKKNPGTKPGNETNIFSWGNLRFRLHRYSAFNQYCYLIMNDFDKTTLDSKKCQVVAFIFQYFYPAGLQCADKGRMFIQYLEQSVNAG